MISELRMALKLVKKDLFSKTGRQTFFLFSSQILTLVFGVLTGVINTRTLGPTDYGVLAFFLTFTGFTLLFFRFGLSASAGILLAEEKDKCKERELIGTTVMIAFFIGLTYSIFMFTSSYFVDDLFHTNVEWIIKSTSILVIALPFTLFVPEIGKGTNQIAFLSVFNVVPIFIYLVGALVLLNLVQIEAIHFILLNLLSTIIGILIVLRLLHPRFLNIHDNLKRIFVKNKEYGFNLYLGQIADQSTYKLDGILISLFVNTTQLGFYSLAIAMTSPMTGLSQALSTSLFRGFVHQNRIPKKVILYNFIWLGFCLLGLITIGPFLISILFGEDFLPTKILILPLALAGFFQGMYQPHNMFLGAKGKGKSLRNISIIQSIFNLIGNFILIYYYGALGAAIASMIATFIAYIGHAYFYRKYTKKL